MKGYKTLIASILISGIGGLQQIGIIDQIPENYQGVTIATIGLVMAFLRLMTNTPILKK